MKNHLFLALACALVHVPSIFIRYAPFRETVTPEQKKKLYPLYTLVVLVSAGIYFFLPDEEIIFYQKWMLVLVAAVLTGINVLLIPGHWREHLFTAGLASVHVSVTFFSAAYAVLSFRCSDNPETVVALSAAVTFLLFLIFLKPFVNCARRVVTPFLQLDTGDYWKRIWFLPLLLFSISFFSTPLDTYSGDVTVLLVRLALLFTATAMCDALSADHAMMLRQIETAKQLSAQEAHYHSMAERVMEARKSRHDFKHHMAAIRKFLDTDDKSGLAEYWDELQIYLHQDTAVPYTGNPALDGVLYRYTALARNEGIPLEFSGVMAPLSMPNTDLCVLLGNALDNALTAARTAKADPRITITATPGPGTQSLLISNTFDGIVREENGQILSRKRKNSPGIGLESIRSVCDKHDAIMDIRHDDSTFRLLLILPTREQPQ